MGQNLSKHNNLEEVFRKMTFEWQQAAIPKLGRKTLLGKRNGK